MSSIMQPTVPCHVPAEAEEDILLGVDTHKDVHAADVITTPGVAPDGRGFPETAEGYRQLPSWTRLFSMLRRSRGEYTRPYCAALTRHCGPRTSRGNQPDKAARQRHGKTDAIDAESAARAVLSGPTTAAAKTSDGPMEMLRLFKLAKSNPQLFQQCARLVQ
ncbi:transposase [Streptomyces sp. NPDC101225]|uniref:IS110 family transposase n=1 Tax=Streptomyces sp. NPDC101225 TaxID=3366135 RepID=UPI0037FCA3A3